MHIANVLQNLEKKINQKTDDKVFVSNLINHFDVIEMVNYHASGCELVVSIKLGTWGLLIKDALFKYKLDLENRFGRIENIIIKYHI